MSINYKSLFLLKVPVCILIIFTYLVIGDYDGVKAHQKQLAVTKYYEDLLKSIDTQKKLANTISIIEQRLKTNPREVQGWLILGRLQKEIGNLNYATKHFKKALELAPNDVGLQMEYVQAKFKQNNGKVEPEQFRMMENILAAEPEHVNIQHLLAAYYFQQHKYKHAIQIWLAIIEQVSGIDDSDKNLILRMVSAAKQRLLDENPYSVKVKIDISKSLKAELEGNETIFVMLKDSNTPAPILAKKINSVQFPVDISLDARDAMLSEPIELLNKNLSIKVKISKSGLAQDKNNSLELERKIKFTDNLQSVSISMMLS